MSFFTSADDDYNMSAIPVTLGPSTVPTQLNLSIEIFDDDINEANQAFVLLLELVDVVEPELAAVLRNACLIFIFDDDGKETAYKGTVTTYLYIIHGHTEHNRISVAMNIEIFLIVESCHSNCICVYSIVTLNTTQRF